jgi:hypothetical protein
MESFSLFVPRTLRRDYPVAPGNRLSGKCWSRCSDVGLGLNVSSLWRKKELWAVDVRAARPSRGRVRAPADPGGIKDVSTTVIPILCMYGGPPLTDCTSSLTTTVPIKRTWYHSTIASTVGRDFREEDYDRRRLSTAKERGHRPRGVSQYYGLLFR